MSGMTTDTEPQLRRNSLGLPELVFQAVTHIAPATSVVFIFPVIAHQAGPAMPLSFVLTTIVCMFVGSTVFQFSKYVPSSGGYYSFSTRGLGSRSGFMATWSYLIYEIIGAAAAVGFLGYLLSDMLKAEFHLNVPWWLVASVTTALIWSLTHRGIQLSARISTLLGGIELLIMLALGITFLVHPGHGSTYLAPLTPASSPHHFGGILAGMVFSVLALAGFEAPAPLAQEARLPGKFIGQAVMLLLVSIGTFYVFMSYASAIGWGTGDMASFASNANPYYVLGHSLWGAGWWFVVLAIINCAIAVGIACANSASRVMYTMGQLRDCCRNRLCQLRVTRNVYDGPGGDTPRQFRAYPSDLPHTRGCDLLHADGWDGSDPSRRIDIAPRLHLRFPGNDYHACSCRFVCHGEPGVDSLYATRTTCPFHGLAPCAGSVGSDTRSATCPLCDRLSPSPLALQPDSVSVPDITHRRIRLYGVARVAQPWNS